jgi:hypothetical protein
MTLSHESGALATPRRVVAVPVCRRQRPAGATAGQGIAAASQPGLPVRHGLMCMLRTNRYYVNERCSFPFL